MFISWSGLGYTVPLTTIPTFVGLQVLAEKVSVSQDTAMCVAGFASAYIIYKIGKYVRAACSTFVILDEDTGERTSIERSHTLYWVPIRYWAYVAAASGFYFAYKIASTSLLGM